MRHSRKIRETWAGYKKEYISSPLLTSMNHLAFLSLSFLNCKMGIIIIPTSWGYVKCKALDTVIPTPIDDRDSAATALLIFRSEKGRFREVKQYIEGNSANLRPKRIALLPCEEGKSVLCSEGWEMFESLGTLGGEDTGTFWKGSMLDLE